MHLITTYRFPHRDEPSLSPRNTKQFKKKLLSYNLGGNRNHETGTTKPIARTPYRSRRVFCSRRKLRTNPSESGTHQFVSTPPSFQDIARRNPPSRHCEIAETALRNPLPTAKNCSSEKFVRFSRTAPSYIRLHPTKRKSHRAWT